MVYSHLLPAHSKILSFDFSLRVLKRSIDNLYLLRMLGGDAYL